MLIDEDDFLEHYGTPRRSGRYPWGSGGAGNIENQRNPSFLDYVADLKKQGMTETQIAEVMGFESTTQLRIRKTMEINNQQLQKIAMAENLRDKGYSYKAIAERMGLAGESSARALCADQAKRKAESVQATANALKEIVDRQGFTDVGAGQNAYLGVTQGKMNVALAMLKEQGYVVSKVPAPQAGTGLNTTTLVIGPPGSTQKDAFLARNEIKPVSQFSNDGGVTFSQHHEPLSISPDRVAVRYGKDGGAKADGVIYVRPGVEDVSLGQNRYGQVRVKVGDGHYLKGMAVYKDDLPDGVDLMFNTNKESTGNKLDAMKKLGESKEYPFGTVVRPLLKGQGGKDEKPYSVMNMVNEEGDWMKWKDTLSSQMLSKQKPTVAAEQLAVTQERRRQEFDEIMKLTNPTIKKKLLESFAEDTDAAAVHLKAAGLPKQSWDVILPVTSIKPGEIFAPKYNDGEKVALIRYPHGGTFEIPELIVNNKNREARAMIGTDSQDAVGIHHKVAERLSGADFDGDTVLVVPNSRGKITSTPALQQLKGFDTQKYKLPDDVPKLKPDRKQTLMGEVSNLITDMTIRGASNEELARAVKHSMVVIDAEKHHLDYKRSYEEHGISKLKAEYQKPYQDSGKAGASTLISRASADIRVPDRRLARQNEGGPINPRTGEINYVPTGRTRTLKDGKVVPRTHKSKKLAETTDAHTLSSGTPIEKMYADHSNKLKALANEARLAALATPNLKYSSSAKKAYAKEVKSLDAKLALAEMNAPRERQAQRYTANAMKAIRLADPNLSKEQLKKIKFAKLEEARARCGVKGKKVVFTDDEWAAIQAGAISHSKLESILARADLDEVRKLATPKPQRLMTSAKSARAQSMLNAGYTRAQVAAQLGVSLTTLDVALKEGG